MAHLDAAVGQVLRGKSSYDQADAEVAVARCVARLSNDLVACRCRLRGEAGEVFFDLFAQWQVMGKGQLASGKQHGEVFDHQRFGGVDVSARAPPLLSACHLHSSMVNALLP